MRAREWADESRERFRFVLRSVDCGRDLTWRCRFLFFPATRTGAPGVRCESCDHGDVDRRRAAAVDVLASAAPARRVPVRCARPHTARIRYQSVPVI